MSVGLDAKWFFVSRIITLLARIRNYSAIFAEKLGKFNHMTKTRRHCVFAVEIEK